MPILRRTPTTDVPQHQTPRREPQEAPWQFHQPMGNAAALDAMQRQAPACDLNLDTEGLQLNCETGDRKWRGGIEQPFGARTAAHLQTDHFRTELGFDSGNLALDARVVRNRWHANLGYDFDDAKLTAGGGADATQVQAGFDIDDRILDIALSSGVFGASAQLDISNATYTGAAHYGVQAPPSATEKAQGIHALDGNTLEGVVDVGKEAKNLLPSETPAPLPGDWGAGCSFRRGPLTSVPDQQAPIDNRLLCGIHGYF